MKMTITVSLGDVRPADEDAKVLRTYHVPANMTIGDIDAHLFSGCPWTSDASEIAKVNEAIRERERRRSPR